jgi:hypothetical protein
MKLTAYMLAFGDDTLIPERTITIPDHETVGLRARKGSDEALAHLLELAFYYGQNDFQPMPIRSLSVGDVVKLNDGSLHRVLGLGWEALPAGTDINTLERGIHASLR